jgi:hypothetical protein
MLLPTVRRSVHLAISILALAFAVCLPGFAQELSQRLILKDGTYQSVTKYEVKGDRVRYLSAERGEWEELPKSLIDWPATEKYAKDRAAGSSTPEAAQLDKELQEERVEQSLRSPQVAPGLSLPDDGGVLLLDTFQGEPELVPIDQNSGQVNKNTKSNMLRAAIIPISSAKQTIELPGSHATVQSHVGVPSLYINLVDEQSATGNEPAKAAQPIQPMQPEMPFDRFKIVRMQTKGGKRIVGDIKIAVYGKVSQEEKLMPTTAQLMTGGWIKVTPISSLDPGEYAVVEMLGKDGVNLYVWDFGVNPNAPANAAAWRPSKDAPAPRSDRQVELEKRENGKPAEEK